MENQAPDEQALDHYESLVHRLTKRERRQMTLQMTPMIDVVFNLLVFFLLTFHIPANEGLIPANLPEVGGPATEMREPIRISIQTDPSRLHYSLSIEGYPSQISSFDRLSSILAGYIQRGDYPKDHPVVIQPEATSAWQHVVRAFDSVVASGFNNISFAPAKLR